MTCDNCTLQLIQVMDRIVDQPVLDRVNSANTYFQCADIRLVEGTPAGGLEPTAPTDHPGVRGRNELAEAREAAAANPENAVMGDLPTPATDPEQDMMAMGTAPDADSGCSLPGSTATRRSTSGIGLLIGSVLLLGVRGRRRR
jgi:hypothetical protein